MRALVTGGAGFIGSALSRRIASLPDSTLLVVDKLGQTGGRDNLDGVLDGDRAGLAVLDLADPAANLLGLIESFRPTVVFHLAAETHVDRSIAGAEPFLQANVIGTYRLLEASRLYLEGAGKAVRDSFRLVHVSTDEVFGALGPEGLFDPATPYAPRSPYSASKAASDHFARAWHHTYGLPVVVTNCSNNFGQRQFPEKLIPLAIARALDGLPIPVYGRGEQVRDWLYVEDHVDALLAAARAGRPGQTYLIGGGEEWRNIDLVHRLCAELDQLRPRSLPYRGLVEFVSDRPGHDFRYALDCADTHDQLGWRPAHGFADALALTVRWYVDNEAWWRGRLPSVDNRWRKAAGAGA